MTAAADKGDGDLFILCADPIPHLLDLLGYDPGAPMPVMAYGKWVEGRAQKEISEPDFWAWMRADPKYSTYVNEGDARDDQPPELPDSMRPVFHLLSAFTWRAKTVLFERNYFDLDYRSELSILQATTFPSLLPNADRMHFFATAPLSSGENRLRDFVLQTVEDESARVKAAQGDNLDAPKSGPLQSVEDESTKVKAAQGDNLDAPKSGLPDPEFTTYLGYIVLKPQLNRGLGRAMVPPFSPLLDGSGLELLDALDVDRQVRTAVPEQVSLFGVYLLAIGVPFMEQDAALLRCAHVSAWMCHYAAVLRGAVARRPTAHFHRAGDWRHGIGRAYPSGGLSTIELTSILRNSDMPAELLTQQYFTASRNPNFSDRIDWSDKVRRLEWAFGEIADEETRNDAKARLRANRLWASENLSAGACRYLNSGIPVILNRRGQGHTQVVVGYLRESDVQGTRLDVDKRGARRVAPSKNPSKVQYLIVSDDQQSPFFVVPLRELVDEILEDSTDVLVPLPNSLWMSGDVAEKAAVKLITQLTRLRHDRVEDTADSETPIDDRGIVSFYNDLQLDEDVYAIRTYASTGVDLKRSIAERLEHSDKELVRRVATMQLPKYVWVVEVLSRTARSSHLPAVVATLVLDASQVVTENLDTREPLVDLPPLFLHLPGHMFVRRFGLGSARVSRKLRPESADEGWLAATADPYESGRWSHKRLRELSAQRNSNQAKSASVTTG